MAYELRGRKQKGSTVALSYYYTDYDDEVGEEDDENETNSNFSDPDYKAAAAEEGTTQRRSCRWQTRREQKPRKRRKLSYSSNQECSTSARQFIEEEKTILSWLINQGQIFENEIVKCGATKEGRVRRDGIRCRCCRAVMNVMEFEIHSGILFQRPYENIIVIRTNNSLLQHLMKIWNKQDRTGNSQYNVVIPKPGATDSSDDACQICADGGDLICCDHCPSTFHLCCTDLKSIPEEKWYCPWCKCKYCGEGGNDEKLTCKQCGKTYHWDCFRRKEYIDLNKNGLGLFCSSTCQEVAEKIKSIIGVKNMIKEGYSWTLIRRMEEAEIEDDHTRMECNTKAALTFELLNESFRTTTDRHSRINILESVVYNRGSNLARLNFSGFYAVILEKNDAVISAATIRMHSNELADMPFIATRKKYRFKGMSRMIFDAFEYIFSYTGVKHLVIPSTGEVADMWEKQYGFFSINDEMKKKLMNYNTLMFPGTFRLQKTFAGTSSAIEIDQNDENCTKLALLRLSPDH